MNIGNKKTIMAYLKGDDGKSAYEIWLDQGNTGTEADFLEALRGPQGPAGEGGGSSEKVIHITDWYRGGYGNDLIRFSMQGFSHFQILSGKIDEGSGYSEMIGMVASKNDSFVEGCGHFNTRGEGYWSERVSMGIEYMEDEDWLWLNCYDTPLTWNDDNHTGLSVYIRLFNVEEE